VQAAVELIRLVEKQGCRGQRAEDRRQRRSLSSVRRPPSSGILLLALCLSLCTTARAAPSLPREQLPVLLNEANTAFQGANAASNPDAAKPLYDRAILLYEKIIDQGGIHNAKLYYNLANAYLLRGLGDGGGGTGGAPSPSSLGPAASTPLGSDLGRAILNYRRAAKLDRSDLNIQKNLTFARSRRVDRVETSTQKRVLETLFFWHYDFSLKTKLLLACLSFAVLCVASILIVWFGRGSAASAAVALSAVLLVCFLASIFMETKREAGTRYGVITAVEVVARQGDGPNYPPSFKDPLHAGMEFELIERRPGWLHIELSDATDAWIPADTAGLV
jgi:hypothetical protein